MDVLPVVFVAASAFSALGADARVLVRAAVFAVGVYSTHSAPDGQLTMFASRYPWMAWDGYAYRHVMLHGYLPGKVPQTVAYFPLYSLVCRGLVGFVGPEVALLAVAGALAARAPTPSRHPREAVTV